MKEERREEREGRKGNGIFNGDGDDDDDDGGW